MNNNEISHSNPRASLLLYCVLTAILLILTGSILYALGILPSELISIVGSPAGLIMAICIIVIAGIVGLLQTDIGRKLLIGAIVVIPVGAVVAYVVIAVITRFSFGVPNSPNSQSSLGDTPQVSLQEPWVPIFRSDPPFCDSDLGTVWSVHQQGTELSCTDSGLAMQQISASIYAQVDLDQERGNTYDQSSFRVTTSASFDNPGDIKTWAGLIVQTPKMVGITGGYLFVLNPLGEWQLQLAKATSIQTIQHGSSMIDPSKPIAITITVKDYVLQVSINDQQVTSLQDIRTPKQGAVGLLVAHPGERSSSAIVTYSSFVLYKFIRPSQGPKTGSITKNLPLACRPGCGLPKVSTVLTTIKIDQEKGVTALNFQFTNGTTKNISLQCNVDFGNYYLFESKLVVLLAGKSGTVNFSFEGVPYSGEEYSLEVTVFGSNWQNSYQTVDLTF